MHGKPAVHQLLRELAIEKSNQNMQFRKIGGPSNSAHSQGGSGVWIYKQTVSFAEGMKICIYLKPILRFKIQREAAKFSGAAWILPGEELSTGEALSYY